MIRRRDFSACFILKSLEAISDFLLLLYIVVRTTLTQPARLDRYYRIVPGLGVSKESPTGSYHQKNSHLRELSYLLLDCSYRSARGRPFQKIMGFPTNYKVIPSWGIPLNPLQLRCRAPMRATAFTIPEAGTHVAPSRRLPRTSVRSDDDDSDECLPGCFILRKVAFLSGIKKTFSKVLLCHFLTCLGTIEYF